MAVSAVALAALGAYKLISGGVKNAKAKKVQKQLAANRPKYSNSPYDAQNLSLAGSELSGSDNNDQSGGGELAESLDAVLKGGGSVNNVAADFSANQQGRQRLALMKSNLRLNKIANYQKALESSEEDRERSFGYNVDAPWKDSAQAAAASATAAQGEMDSGLDTIGSAIGSYGQEVSSKNQLNNYLKLHPPTTQTQQPA